MKRLIICCDGTWDKLSDPYPTNVVKIARAFKDVDDQGVAQLVYYDEGLGTNSIKDRIPGGAFGLGIGRDIRDAYCFLSCNYSQGDEIYLFGFSRGCTTVRCLAQMINDYGIVGRQFIRFIPQIYKHYSLTRGTAFKRGLSLQEKNKILSANSPPVYSGKENPFTYDFEIFRRGAERESLSEVTYNFLNHWVSNLNNQAIQNVKINVLGCWDTVGQLGIPDIFSWLPFDRHSRIRFHDYKVSENVVLALHACAVDECRRYLRNTLMEVAENAQTRLRQFWFPGDHGSIGSGNIQDQKYTLSNIPLHWMINSFDAHKSMVNRDHLHTPQLFQDDDICNPLATFPKNPGFFPKVGLAYKRPLPETTQYYDTENDNPNQFHFSVIRRLAAKDLDYKQKFPKNLEPFREHLEKQANMVTAEELKQWECQLQNC